MLAGVPVIVKPATSSALVTERCVFAFDRAKGRFRLEHLPAGWLTGPADGNAVFYVETIDISGQRERFGPFALGEAYGLSSGSAYGSDGSKLLNPIYLPIIAN